MGYLCVQQEEVDEKSESGMIEVFDVDVGNDWDWGAREREWTSLSFHPQNSFHFQKNHILNWSHLVLISVPWMILWLESPTSDSETAAVHQIPMVVFQCHLLYDDVSVPDLGK